MTALLIIPTSIDSACNAPHPHGRQEAGIRQRRWQHPPQRQNQPRQLRLQLWRRRHLGRPPWPPWPRSSPAVRHPIPWSGRPPALLHRRLNCRLASVIRPPDRRCRRVAHRFSRAAGCHVGCGSSEARLLDPRAESRILLCPVCDSEGGVNLASTPPPRSCCCPAECQLPPARKSASPGHPSR